MVGSHHLQQIDRDKQFGGEPAHPLRHQAHHLLVFNRIPRSYQRVLSYLTRGFLTSYHEAMPLLRKCFQPNFSKDHNYEPDSDPAPVRFNVSAKKVHREGKNLSAEARKSENSIVTAR